MPLYHVMDSDRPGYVLADSYADAVRKWRNAVALEHDERPEDTADPSGVAVVAEDTDVIITCGWIK